MTKSTNAFSRSEQKYLDPPELAYPRVGFYSETFKIPADFREYEAPIWQTMTADTVLSLEMEGVESPTAPQGYSGVIWSLVRLKAGGIDITDKVVGYELDLEQLRDEVHEGLAQALWD